MNDGERFPHLNDAEQEVLLCAEEGTELFHVVWGLRGIVGYGTDEELRPHADALIRKLIQIGWVRLIRWWVDRLPADQHQTVELVGGGSTQVNTVGHEESIPAEEVDAVLRDPKSWGLGESYEVTLVTTDEGGAAIASGALNEAYDKFMRPRDASQT